jgi:adenine-specific DNA-methyltransferase
MNFIENESEQKLRGGYYTPLDLATYIARWTLEKDPRNVLEPSCGDGVFVRALANVGLKTDLAFTGFEIVKTEAAKARELCENLPGLRATIHGQDFLGWASSAILTERTRFDAALGNPPFIRYQYLTAEAQHKAEAIFEVLRLPFTKHTNAWVPFVLASVALLAPGGRLGMIVPSEIVHIPHAQPLRTYLGNTCSRLLIIDPEEIWFDGTLQGAVILLAERKDVPTRHSDGLGIVRVTGRGFLNRQASTLFDDTARLNGTTVQGKWTRALLTSNERDLLSSLQSHPEVHRFCDIAKVDVGIVTGANKFFLVDDDIVERFGLRKFAHPMFGRSEHCPGIIYDQRQHEHNARTGFPTNFIWLKDSSVLPSAVQSYIRLGESQKLHTRYKCRVRTPWYTVPSVYSTKVGMLKRAHDTPRLIYNRMDAFTTDTAYRITTTSIGIEKLVHCFLNPLTALTADLEGRHYGGGVLELVPSEIERLLVPIPKKVRPRLRKLDVQVRTLPTVEVLDVQSQYVLGAMGVKRSEQEALLSAWLRLRNRRQRNPEEETEVSQSQS